MCIVCSWPKLKTGIIKSKNAILKNGVCCVIPVERRRVVQMYNMMLAHRFFQYSSGVYKVYGKVCNSQTLRYLIHQWHKLWIEIYLAAMQFTGQVKYWSLDTASNMSLLNRGAASTHTFPGLFDIFTWIVIMFLGWALVWLMFTLPWSFKVWAGWN